MFIKIEEAIERLRRGEMLVMADAQDRENEGDIIFAASSCSKERVNFLLNEARGVICVSLAQDLAQKLELPLMVESNSSKHETAFTITVDAKDALTGVSTAERHETISLFAKKDVKADDFVRPGHINPLIAKPGGVLQRAGHTEGSVDLCLLAGLEPACVICEILRPDGEMARRDDLAIFCKKHDLAMVTIEDLIAYRLANEELIRLAASEDKACVAGKSAKKLTYQDAWGARHQVFAFEGKSGAKALNERNLVKFYPAKTDLISDPSFCDFLEDLDVLEKEGGFLIFVPEKSKDEKSYSAGALLLRALGLRRIRVLSRSKPAQLSWLKGFDLELV